MKEDHGIHLIHRTDGHQMCINVDIHFDVAEKDGVEGIHITPVLYKLVLEKLQENELAVLTPGTYRLCLTGSIIDLSDLQKEEGDDEGNND